ncbi:MAG: radical SAM protein [Blautia sp.]|nr:radical SAM protein [Blautia sp.]
MGDVVYAARAALHMWEEPCISGSRGSGTVFFSGCTLRCVYCQNHEIAEGRAGLPVTVRRLSEIFLMLQEKGAANISLVTASHFVPQILEALADAKKDGLHLPVVYNSGGYESPDTLRALNGVVDIYLPDLKYMDPDLAEAFSHARDYPEAAREAIREMVAQTGPCVFDEAGYAVRGTIVRHLILPGHTKDSMRILSYLHETYGDEIYISLMNQYTPVIRQERYPELNRRLTKREYQKVLSHALSIGITNGFFQEGTTAEESFIPAFDYEGVRPE